jgi:hypothetical protein
LPDLLDILDSTALQKFAIVIENSAFSALSEEPRAEFGGTALSAAGNCLVAQVSMPREIGKKP